MTTQEFSREFDILYNNIMSNAAPGLNEYEKSVLLTQAQEAVVLDIYKGNYDGYSFENTAEVINYLDQLVGQVELSTPTNDSKITTNSKFYQLPSDVWFITYESSILEDESLGCHNNIEAAVIPVTQDKLYYTLRNPFKGDSFRRVLRLIKENKVELISKYKIKSYLVRYLKQPEPIILEDLTNYNLSINGKTQVNECKLNSSVHRAILNKAIVLAKALWIQGNN